MNNVDITWVGKFEYLYHSCDWLEVGVLYQIKQLLSLTHLLLNNTLWIFKFVMKYSYKTPGKN